MNEISFFRRIICLCVIILTAGCINAGIRADGKYTLKGTVYDKKDNYPIIGASIIVEGTKNGTVTDFDGNFKLSLQNSTNTIKVSYVGYKSAKFTINGSASGKVYLVEDKRKNKYLVSIWKPDNSVDYTYQSNVNSVIDPFGFGNISTTQTNTTKSAEQICYEAQNYYFGNNGITIDYIKAFDLYKKAAEMGNKEAQFSLAYLYENGIGTSQNYPEAFRWYKKAAEQGQAYAQCNLGIMYYYGKGVAKNYPEAFRWCQKAAEQNIPAAQICLATMYFNGDGVAKNETEAFNRFNKAAEQGNAYALYIIGQFYDIGQFVKRNLSTALAYYNLAAEKGYEKAAANAKKLSAKGVKPSTLNIGSTLQNPVAQNNIVSATTNPTATVSANTSKSSANTTQKAVTTTSYNTQKSANASTAKVYTTQKRIALVIGNGDYTDGRLLTPVNDAGDMRAMLSRLGFKVKGGSDMKSKGEMRKAIREFCKQAQNCDAALFYYSGHARQDDGKNYLIPTRADIKSEADIEDECVELGWILKSIKETGVKNVIILLDACRNAPPIASIYKSSDEKGLANFSGQTGTYIGFATQPGKVASAGLGKRNSPYTAALLEYLEKPGIPHYRLFREVKKKVMEMTDGQQMPDEDDKLPEDFIFNPGK